MTDIHEDLIEFLERRLADLRDRDDSPEQEILDALIEWIDRGCPPPTISVTCHADRSVTTVDRMTASTRQGDRNRSREMPS